MITVGKTSKIQKESDCASSGKVLNLIPISFLMGTLASDNLSSFLVPMVEYVISNTNNPRRLHIHSFSSLT